VWLLLADSRRSMAIAYGIMAIMVFSINLQYWTFGFALSKLITVVMAMLIMMLNTFPDNISDIGISQTGRIFRLTGFSFFMLLIIFTVNSTSEFLSLSIDQTLPSLFILVCGFMVLATSQDPFRVIIGLMVTLVGFEIIYGAVEQSLMINGLLAAVFMVIALVGSYLTSSFESKDTE
jgi:hypothetical protein